MTQYRITRLCPCEQCSQGPSVWEVSLWDSLYPDDDPGEKLGPNALYAESVSGPDDGHFYDEARGVWECLFMLSVCEVTGESPPCTIEPV